MTVSVSPAPQATTFDWAVFSAMACGWPSRPAFEAVCVMLAAGMSAREVELVFLDARRRVQ